MLNRIAADVDAIADEQGITRLYGLPLAELLTVEAKGHLDAVCELVERAANELRHVGRHDEAKVAIEARRVLGVLIGEVSQ